MIGKKNGKGTIADINSPEKLNRLVEGTVIDGNIKTKGNIRIDGEVNGNIIAEGRVVIGVSGVITGDITCEYADVEGKIKGNVKVHQVLTLKATAVLHGDILYGKLNIDGAEFVGSSQLISANKSIKREEALA